MNNRTAFSMIFLKSFTLKELQNFFVNGAGIGMNEGSTFGPGGEGFMRMNVGTTHKTVIKAMEQIEKAVSSLR